LLEGILILKNSFKLLFAVSLLLKHQDPLILSGVVFAPFVLCLMLISLSLDYFDDVPRGLERLPQKINYGTLLMV